MISILSLLISNAVTTRRDISILFNRVAIIVLVYCILHDIMSLSIISKGIGLHGGLLQITNISQRDHSYNVTKVGHASIPNTRGLRSYSTDNRSRSRSHNRLRSRSHNRLRSRLLNRLRSRLLNRLRSRLLNKWRNRWLNRS